MEINYKFDDSKDEIQKGVKKNKFTHDRIHTPDTPEFDPSSGVPDEGYGRDHERIESDNPSFEGNYWFVSKNFNDKETNKRPLHPQKDYLNPQDTYTGDDHLETIGVTHPEDKVPHHLNPNTDHENYDIDGKMDIDDKGGHHLMGGEVVKEEIKHIYKEKTNTMKSTMQEQIDRIKQMILFEEGMSYKDVKSLTEQDEEIAVAIKAAPSPTDDMVTTLSKGDAKAVADKGAGEVFVSDKVSAEVPVEKGTEKVGAFKPAPEEFKSDSPFEAMDIDAQIKAVNGKIDDVKKAIDNTEGDDEVADLKSKLEQLENDLDKLKSQKDSQEKEKEATGEEPKEEPIEKPKEEPKEEPIEKPVDDKGPDVKMVTLPLNKATEIRGFGMSQQGTFFNQVNFALDGKNFMLTSVTDDAMGNPMGIGEDSIRVNYYNLSENTGQFEGGKTFSVRAGQFDAVSPNMVSAITGEKIPVPSNLDYENSKPLNVQFIATSTEDSDIFLNAMDEIGVELIPMVVPSPFTAYDPGVKQPVPAQDQFYSAPQPGSAAFADQKSAQAFDLSQARTTMDVRGRTDDDIQPTLRQGVTSDFSKNADVEGVPAYELPPEAGIFDAIKAPPAMIQHPIQSIPQNGMVVYSFADKNSFDAANQAGPSVFNQVVADKVRQFRGQEKPIGPGGPEPISELDAVGRALEGLGYKFNGETWIATPGADLPFSSKVVQQLINQFMELYNEQQGGEGPQPGPIFGRGEILTATGGGNNFEIDLGSSDLRWAADDNFKGGIGRGKVTKGKPGELKISFEKLDHIKYGPGELKGTNEGTKDIFYLDYIDSKGNTMNRGKAIFRMSPAKRAIQSFKPAKFTQARIDTPYTAYQTGVSRAGQFTAPAARVAPAQNPFAQTEYDVFGGGGKGITGMNNNELKTLIQQLQSQLDGQEDEKEELNESRRINSRRNSRRRPTYRTRLTESKRIMDKIVQHKDDLKVFAKNEGVPEKDLMSALKAIATGAMDTLEKTTKKTAEAVGKFLGMLKANKEITDNDMKTAEKNLNEAIRRSKNVIKLTEGDLYKIVDRVLKEKNK